MLMSNDSVASPIRVMVVDDDSQMRWTLVQTLEQSGIQVLEASSGELAFKLLTENPVNLVISDIQMLNGNGFELLEKIRKSSFGNLPLILMSGGLELEESEWRMRGANFFIHKPFSKRDLLSAVQNLVPQIAA